MFIVFEGIDGSGKTTTAKIVTDMLVEMGVPAIYTYEPYFYKDIIKNYVHDYILATALFSADRIRFALLLRKLITYIEKGQKFTHHELLKLYEKIINEVNYLNSSREWANRIDRILKQWAGESA